MEYCSKKNIPYVYLNYKQKSIVGCTIFNILLVFFGGILPILQMFIEQINGNISSYYRIMHYSIQKGTNQKLLKMNIYMDGWILFIYCINCIS